MHREQVARSEPAGKEGTVLLVGEGASGQRLRQYLERHHCEHVVFLDFVSGRQAGQELGIQWRYLEVGHRRECVERESWRWASDFVMWASRGPQPLLPAHAAAFVRRQLFASHFLHIGWSKARVEEFCASFPSADGIVAMGLAPLDATAFAEHFGPHLSLLQFDTRVESAGEAPLPPARSGSRFVQLASIALEAVRERVRASAEVRRIRAELLASGQGPVLLALAHSTPHVRMISGALKEMRRRGWRCVGVDVSHSNDPATCEWGDTIDLAYELERLTLRDELGRLVRRRRGWDRRFREAVRAWTEAAELDAYAEVVQAAAHHWLGTEAPAILGALGRLMDATGPALVLTVSETYAAVEAAVPVAHRRGAPVVNMQHGVIAETLLRAEFDFDAFCVYGPAYAEMLERLGTPSERIVVTGDPRFDAKREATSREVDASSPQQSPRLEARVLFAAQYASFFTSDWALYKSLAVVLEYASSHPEMELVIKWHPLGEGREAGYFAALEDYPEATATCYRDADLHELILASDAVAVLSSTVGFEAAALSRPVILVNPTREPDYIPLVAEGVAVRATNVKEFGERLSQAVAGVAVEPSAWKRVRERYAAPAERSAAQRLADVCESLAHHRVM